ncbi:extracellular solute-binding protein [Actinomadura fulvescens]|uniref:Extracellular solute-binding protein n=1 Tax=Actinomadura fulvescens TaxID=46160 RepID=A0ABP6CHA6_9ACTN
MIVLFPAFTTDWGNVPAWLSAVGTLFALLFAAVAVVVSRRTYQIESDRDRVNEEARRAAAEFDHRAQAALVSAWWGENDRDGRLGAFVRNASNAPVYQAYLTVMERDGDSEGVKLHAHVLPPGEHPRFFPVDPAMISGGRTPGHQSAYRVRLCFTDAAGVRWMRNQFGQLTKLGPSLRIMADQLRADTFSQFDEDFQATYGVHVDYAVTPAGYSQQDYTREAQASGAADALIAPNDWIGDLARRGIIEPTTLSADHRSAFPDWTLKALTMHGRLYGLPMTVDTVALIRNTDLAPAEPATLDELISAGEALRAGGRATHVCSLRVGEGGDPFQLWPLFASAGGRLFGRDQDGEWDRGEVALADEGSVAAFERLRELGEAGAGILRRATGREDSFKLFTSCRTAFLITTTDGLLAARQAGVPFAVSPVPPFADGIDATTFSLVRGLLMTRSGPNKTIAHDLFADYLTQPRVLDSLARNLVSPVAIRTNAAHDAWIEYYRRLCDTGMIMPTFPEMERVWRITGRAQAAVIAGAPARATAEQAAEAVASLFVPRP